MRRGLDVPRARDYSGKSSRPDWSSAMAAGFPVLRPVVAAVLLFAAMPVFAEAPAFTQPNKFALTIKGGHLKLVDDTQTIAGSARSFDDSADNIFAIEGETRFQGENVSIGGEFIRYRNRFRRVTATDFEDRMHTYALVAKAKYFFGHSAWQPYVGAGVGRMEVHDLGGPIEGLSGGYALQGVAGLQWRTDRVGLRAEYLYLHGRVEDDKSDEVRASVQGAFLGVSFFFGPKSPR
jgi:hypothetical protein